MTDEDLFRVYFDPDEIGADGYPLAWHKIPYPGLVEAGDPSGIRLGVKDVVRMRAGHRCVRCHHPFVVGETKGEWSPCDVECTHGLPLRRSCAGYLTVDERDMFGRTAGELVEGYKDSPCRWREPTSYEGRPVPGFSPIEAQWRVLTVHHLNGVKVDCRWWNLAPLCQRCHLTIQAKVYMERPWSKEHSEWFKPYAAGWYAFRYLGLELTRREVDIQLDHLLELERTQERLW